MQFIKFADKHKKMSTRGVLPKEDVSKIFSKFIAKHLFRSLFLNKVVGWKLETFRSSRWRCFVKHCTLKIITNFAENSQCWSFFLIKLHILCLKLYERRLRHRCFAVKFAIILKNILECLLVTSI